MTYRRFTKRFFEGHAALVIAEALPEEMGTFSVLSLHGVGPLPPIRRALIQMRELQTWRYAADPGTRLKSRHLPTLGFVFSTIEIEVIRRRDRLKAAVADCVTLDSKHNFREPRSGRRLIRWWNAMGSFLRFGFQWYKHNKNNKLCKYSQTLAQSFHMVLY